jgi:hypothetical protein
MTPSSSATQPVAHHRTGRQPDPPSSKPRCDGTLMKALARAWRWHRMLDHGVYASVSDIGDAENISKSYVSRILRLALLAPDIVDAILAGRMDQGMMLGELERPLPAGWEGQRAQIGRPTLSIFSTWPNPRNRSLARASLDRR